jgi:hypothetical protein
MAVLMARIRGCAPPALHRGARTPRRAPPSLGRARSRNRIVAELVSCADHRVRELTTFADRRNAVAACLPTADPLV